MKIIIPMAGMGKRMRPHTLTIPKPLIPVAGKPMVHRLVEEISKVSAEKIDEIAFIVGHFGSEVEKSLLKIAQDLGAKGSIYYQDEPLGTAHAVYCAAPSLTGKTIIAFADTLFDSDIKIDDNQEAVICVQKVKNPEAFGVVKTNESGLITDFIEKPKTFVSDMAIIGIYYFKDGLNLKSELEYLLKNNIQVNGEFQLTDALENMKNKGVKFYPGVVKEWLDCGNKDSTVYTNGRILDLKRNEKLISDSLIKVNSVIIEPCFIGENVNIVNSVIGPYVSIGNNTKINNSLISNSIIQNNTQLENVTANNSMIGNFVNIKNNVQELNVGDYNTLMINC
ncbi:MAG: nucleotidyltransferase [Bacteroidetes bacterium GWA2_31_9]|nr:MAG: nucleotidyltransferase [Bacteroidetes bacterium GWA2_31_9]